MITEFRMVKKLPIEWSFVALNAMSVFLLLVLLVLVLKEWLKTKHKTKFWLLFMGIIVLMMSRGLLNLCYEGFNYSFLGKERAHFTFIALSIYWIVLYLLLLKMPHEKFKTFPKRKPLEKHKEKSKAESTEAQEMQELKTGLTVVEDAYKHNVIDKKTYEKDKAEIIALENKIESEEHVQKISKKMSDLILEIEADGESEENIGNGELGDENANNSEK